MKHHITIEQLETLSPAAQERLATWFDEHTANDDDLVRVYIPQERDGEYGGEFADQWDREYEFVYPEEYIGRLKHHLGTILPLLDIGQMIEIITESDVAMTVGVSGNTCDELWNVVKTLLEK